MQSNWKRKTKEFINLPKGYCSATTTIVHLDGCHTNFSWVCVYWLRRVMLLYGLREGHELQSLIKTTSSSQIQSDGKGKTVPLPITFSET